MGNQSNQPQVVADKSEQATATPARRRAALTQIGEWLSGHEHEDGFLRAKADADRALKENKIILNKRFVLESTLGAGGMGTVYKAQDLRKIEAQDTNPYVATKVLNADFKDHPDAFIALQREASRSSMLAHPNIVTVHDFDRDGDTIYMTMELLQGEGLDSLLAKHPQGLPQEQAFTILADIGRALSFAHQKGVIHCDLKPANIFISENAAKVLDFGIARLAMQSQDHFDAGKIGALTPGYASLEMFGKEDPDASDDVFATAVITYELLTGRHPYQGKSAPAALALQLQPSPIDSLSKRQWKALSRALALKKAERTASIDEFVEAMTQKPPFPVFKILSLLLLGTLGLLAYVTYFGENELKTVLAQTLTAGQKCIASRDYNCAVDSANAALKLDPQNTAAKTLWQRAQQGLEQTKRQAQIDQALDLANQCLQQKDYQCVLTQTDQIKQLDPDQVEAKSLRINAEQAIKAKAQKLNALLNPAKQCLDSHNYPCAIENAQAALALEPQNTTALSIKEKAQYALKQQQQDLDKANLVLQDGKRCLAKFDYSCAIAKSESALAFVPDYAPALALKRQAQAAMDKAKKAIQIK